MLSRTSSQAGAAGGYCGCGAARVVPRRCRGSVGGRQPPARGSDRACRRVRRQGRQRHGVALPETPRSDAGGPPVPATLSGAKDVDTPTGSSASAIGRSHATSTSVPMCAATSAAPGRCSGASFGSAGINRHEERNERVRHRRSSAPRWPWAMRRRPRGRGRSVGQGYLQAGLLSREISVSGCRRCPNERKATSQTAPDPRAVGGPRAVREPLHAGSLHAREPGDPTLARPADHGAGRSGKAEAARLR